MRLSQVLEHFWAKDIEENADMVDKPNHLIGDATKTAFMSFAVKLFALSFSFPSYAVLLESDKGTVTS